VRHARTHRALLTRPHRLRPHHPDDRPDRFGLVVALELGRVERGDRTVEEDGVLAAEPVAEQAGEGVERDRLFGDRGRAGDEGEAGEGAPAICTACN
jgi:hypothetical protein